MAYCDETDLLVGNIPTPAYIDKTKFVNDAADEMDSYLGLRYVTPIILNEADPEMRPSYLLLKRVNAHLATGRLILAAAAGSEDDNLHAYGQSMVNESLKTLAYLADLGNPAITGATTLEGVGEHEVGFLVKNADTGSFVDAFYEVTNPTYVIEPRPRYWV